MDIKKLLQHNQLWAAKELAKDPDFFSDLSQQQKPKYLWIGCSDSRVPANQIIGLKPGEIFVHRNVANQVIHTDFNCLSVIQYAVEMLKVEHIIVCGHYGCGGVIVSHGEHTLGLIDNWLRHIRDLMRLKGPWLKRQRDAGHDSIDTLCELNVMRQVANVGQTTILHEAWARGQNIQVHGWIYGIQTGIIKDLQVDIGSLADLEILEQRFMDM